MLYQLSYTRAPHNQRQSALNLVTLILVEREGFEPSYSERTDLQSVAFNHSATSPNRTQDYADNLTGCQTHLGLKLLVPDVGIEPTTF